MKRVVIQVDECFEPFIYSREWERHYEKVKKEIFVISISKTKNGLGK